MSLPRKHIIVPEPPPLVAATQADIENLTRWGKSSNIDRSEFLADIRSVERERRGVMKIPRPRTLNNSEWPPNYADVYDWRAKRLALFEEQPELINAAKRYYALPENIPHFVNDWCDTYDPRNLGTAKPLWMPFIMFEKQEELLRFFIALMLGQGEGVVEKSRDMGATWVGVVLTVALYLFWPGAAIGWGSQTADKVDAIGNLSSVLEKCRSLIRRLPKIFLPPGLNPFEDLMENRFVHGIGGATIEGGVGNAIGRSGRTSIYFVDEAAHLEKPEIVEAALLATSKVKIYISSVTGPNTVFYRKRNSGIDWQEGKPIDKFKPNVFVLDQTDHPEKTKEWIEGTKASMEEQGLGHVYAQEYGRDYMGAQIGRIINPVHIEAAFGADKKLKERYGFEVPQDEGHMGAQDIADGGIDTNVFTRRQGNILRVIKEWSSARDIGETAREAIGLCAGFGEIQLQYDASGGYGGSFKSEGNRLSDPDVNQMPEGVTLVPWLAGAKVQNPGGHINTNADGTPDTKSPKNKDLFHNFRAQAWNHVAQMFLKTWQFVEQGTECPWEMLIIIDPAIGPAMWRKLQMELAQAVWKKSPASMKLLVDKVGEGAKSPNLADSLIMNFFPVVTIEVMAALSAPKFIPRD